MVMSVARCLVENIVSLHQKIRTREKPFKNNVLKRLYSRLYPHHTLGNKYRVETRISCDVCGRSSFKIDTLKSWEIHVEEKPCTCHECGKTSLTIR